MIKIVRSKLHGLRVTDSALNYHGSITLDPDQCRAAGIYPLEFVEIWNKNSGQRISTYVIYGEAGSRCCILNGAAARTCQVGDELIICASEYINSPSELFAKKTIVLCFDENNIIIDKLCYVVTGDENGNMAFDIEDYDSPFLAAAGSHNDKRRKNA